MVDVALAAVYAVMDVVATIPQATPLVLDVLTV